MGIIAIVEVLDHFPAIDKVDEILNIFPSLYPLVCRFQNNNDVEMEVVIAKISFKVRWKGGA